MKKIIAAVVIFILLVGTLGTYIISSRFTAETFEQSIYAQDETMQNTWAQTSNQMKMGGLTVKNFSEQDLKKMEMAMKRYADKPNLMMVWAKEQGNTMTPELHSKFMDTINKIAAAKIAKQDSKISVVQEYRTWRTASFKGTIGTMLFSFPSEKAKAIEDRIITNKATKQTWKTGNDEVKDPFAS